MLTKQRFFSKSAISLPASTGPLTASQYLARTFDKSDQKPGLGLELISVTCKKSCNVCHIFVCYTLLVLLSLFLFLFSFFFLVFFFSVFYYFKLVLQTQSAFFVVLWSFFLY